MIDTENLTKKFGNMTAVDSVTLRVDEGEVFAFLGPNGAGKTTTVRMLACLVAKSSGGATIGDYESASRADQPKIRKMTHTGTCIPLLNSSTIQVVGTEGINVLRLTFGG